jgi:hypothetical protein
MKIINKDLDLLWNGLFELTSPAKAGEPISLSMQTHQNILDSKKAVRDAVTTFHEARRILFAKYKVSSQVVGGGFVNNRPANAADIPAFQKEWSELNNAERNINIVPIKLADLNVEENRFSPALIELLYPMIEHTPKKGDKKK